MPKKKKKAVWECKLCGFEIKSLQKLQKTGGKCPLCGTRQAFYVKTPKPKEPEPFDLDDKTKQKLKKILSG